MHFDVISRLRQSQLKFVVTISGGGSPFLSDYLSVPGASQTFLEARIPYAPLATDDFLGFHPENYTSERTARLLAAAALRRAQILAPDANPLALLGVGATAALVSERPKKGAHRVHCSILSRLGTFSASMTLKKNARTRAQEERLAADFIFSTLMKTMEKVEQGSHKFWAENREILPLERSNHSRATTSPNSPPSSSITKPRHSSTLQTIPEGKSFLRKMVASTLFLAILKKTLDISSFQVLLTPRIEGTPQSPISPRRASIAPSNLKYPRTMSTSRPSTRSN